MSKRPTMVDVMSRVRDMSAAKPAPAPAAETASPVQEAAIPAREDQSATEAQTPAPAPDLITRHRDSESTRSRSHVETSTAQKRERKAGVPKGFNVRPERIEKPHQSIYAHPFVFREIRKIAAAEDMKPQDLYREGLRAVLKKRGLDFDKLDRGEV